MKTEIELKKGMNADPNVPYLYVRVWSSGAAWVYYRKIKGKPRRITLGKYPDMPRRDAVRKSEEISGNIARAGNPDGTIGPGSSVRPTFADAWRCYSTQRKVGSRQLRQFERYLAPRFGTVELQAIRRSAVRALHAEISERFPVAANRTIALMSAAINAAIRDEIFPGPNPAAMIRKNAERPRRRYLERAELDRVLASLRRRMRSARTRTGAEALTVMLFTGARSGNVESMEWSELELEREEWIIPAGKAKARKEIRVKLNSVTLELLRKIAERQRGKNRFVFPHRFEAGKHITTVNTLWNALRAECGLADARIHDLRHTFATYELAAGVDIATVSESLGHADISTTKRIYAHVLDDRKRAAAEAAESAILGKNPEAKAR